MSAPWGEPAIRESGDVEIWRCGDPEPQITISPYLHILDSVVGEDSNLEPDS
jgi:hypothetical protein